MPRRLPLSELLAQIASGLTVEEPTARRVLVLSPHPDDDAIGCGGTLARHGELGSEITVLYLTDGKKGAPAGLHTESQLIELREREAKAACRTLGVRHPIFLRRPDGNLQSDDDTVDAVISTLDETEPEVVYLPSFFDGFFHPDHLQTNIILSKVAAKRGICFMCYGYEVYTPLIPNRLVDISTVADFKMLAIGQHKTQASIRAYSKILELNKYRAAMLGPLGSSYVEAFLRADSSTYLELFSCFFNINPTVDNTSRPASGTQNKSVNAA